MGFCQVYTYSFISPKEYDKLCIPQDSEARNSITLINPLGEENSVMRTTALSSVLEVMAYNANRKAENIMLFENATVYKPAEDGMSKERKQLVLSFGKCAGWDFYTMKGFVESMFQALRVDIKDVFASQDPSFHPGRQATISIDGKTAAVFGQINPIVAENFSMPSDTYAAVIELDVLFDNRNTEKAFKKLPAFPAIERDIALIADDETECGTIISTIEKAGVKTLESVKVFDVYKGKGVEDGKKSVAFRLTLRHAEKTLNDEDADKAIEKILKKLSAELNIELRK
jgi:phenylalanyl-tRNA synthetase beta chain